MNWPEEIVKLVMVKQALASVDEGQIFPFYLPALAAQRESIEAVEEVLNIRLDSKYADFLQYADGWRGFFQAVDLFGTVDLKGSDKMIAARTRIDYLDDDIIASTGYHRDEFLPIAVDQNDRDIFVMTLPSASGSGEVLWFAGELVEVFADFDQFYLAMVDYNRADLEFMSGRASN